MMCPEDTRIVFLGGACSLAAMEAVVRLAGAGYNVIAGPHDPREGALFIERGITCVSGLADAVSGADIVLTSCAHPADVEELYLDANGLLSLMDPGTYAIDLSFTTPRLAKEIQAMAAISDVDFIDAPLVNVGDDEGAVCFVGGEPEAVKEISPLLPYFAETIYPQEEPGAGQLAAVIAYVGLAGSLMGTIEALALARIAGASTKTPLNVLASTAAASRALVEYSPRIMNYDFEGRIRVCDLLDALDVVLDTAEQLDVTVPMTETAYQLYDLLGVVGGDEMNIQALALLYEDEKTCAEYGLDWALADQARSAQDMQQGYNLQDLIESAAEYAEAREAEQFNHPGPLGPLPNASLHPRDFTNGIGGRLSAGDFFSKN